jgi:hypothetical protein
LKIAGDAGGSEDDIYASEVGRMEIERTPVVAMATTAKAAQVARMARTSTSVVKTPVAIVAIVTAAKTAEWVWRPTTGPFRKSREMPMALMMWLMS